MDFGGGEHLHPQRISYISPNPNPNPNPNNAFDLLHDLTSLVPAVPNAIDELLPPVYGQVWHSDPACFYQSIADTAKSNTQFTGGEVPNTCQCVMNRRKRKLAANDHSTAKKRRYVDHIESEQVQSLNITTFRTRARKIVRELQQEAARQNKRYKPPARDVLQSIRCSIAPPHAHAVLDDHNSYPMIRIGDTFECNFWLKTPLNLLVKGKELPSMGQSAVRFESEVISKSGSMLWQLELELLYYSFEDGRVCLRCQHSPANCSCTYGSDLLEINRDWKTKRDPSRWLGVKECEDGSATVALRIPRTRRPLSAEEKKAGVKERQNTWNSSLKLSNPKAPKAIVIRVMEYNSPMIANGNYGQRRLVRCSEGFARLIAKNGGKVQQQRREKELKQGNVQMVQEQEKQSLARSFHNTSSVSITPSPLVATEIGGTAAHLIAVQPVDILRHDIGAWQHTQDVRPRFTCPGYNPQLHEFAHLSYCGADDCPSQQNSPEDLSQQEYAPSLFMAPNDAVVAAPHTVAAAHSIEPPGNPQGFELPTDLLEEIERNLVSEESSFL